MVWSIISRKSYVEEPGMSMKALEMLEMLQMKALENAWLKRIVVEISPLHSMTGVSSLIASVKEIPNDVGCVNGLGRLVFVSLQTCFSAAHAAPFTRRSRAPGTISRRKSHSAFPHP